MRIYRCFCDSELQPGETIELPAPEAEHLVRVRRASAGDDVVAINGRGIEAQARLLEAGKRSARIEVIERLRCESSPPPALEIAPSLTRTSAFEDMLQRSIELGATAIRPIVADRGVVRLDERKAHDRAERWRRLAVEALKQCERLWLPEVAEPAELDDTLAAVRSSGAEAVVLAERSEKAPPLADLLAEAPDRPRCFFFGPEGGWTDEERAVFEEARACQASFGRAILRAETAVMAALAVAQAMRRD
ncbi:16S rRNA (uracil(1498)-N(3))-methyltransferase [bacterium]|nr:16S rRNA (uracil(1498)-N(3))-methyltransferase [bacterium]